MGVRALSATSVERPVGGAWDMLVDVRDNRDALVAYVPTVTITLPGGTLAVVTPETLSDGVYLATYLPATAGRHIAQAVAVGYGVAEFACYATPVTAPTAMPTVDDVVVYLGGAVNAAKWAVIDGPTTTYPDVADALAAESAAQRRKCQVGAEYPEDLRQALLRRVARNLAMRALPLSVMPPNFEGAGPVRPSGTDPEVRRLEAPHRRLPAG